MTEPAREGTSAQVPHPDPDAMAVPRLSKLALAGLAVPAGVVGAALVTYATERFDAGQAVGLALVGGLLGFAISMVARDRIKMSLGVLRGRRAAKAGAWLSAILFLSPVLAAIAFALFLGWIIFFGDWTMGRPLRVRRRPVLPDVHGGDRPATSGPDPATARFFVEAARKEAASAPVFRELADDLTALGAPPDLVAWARRAADDEDRHAALCLEAARGVGAGAVHLGPVAAPVRNEDDDARLFRIAREAVRDGVFGEGLAADIAARAAAESANPAVRTMWQRIADDERDHAALAQAVLSFCAARSRRARLGARVATWTLPRRVRAFSLDGAQPTDGVPRPAHDLLGPARRRARRQVGQALRAPGAARGRSSTTMPASASADETRAA